jgi:hypothetical protein
MIDMDLLEYAILLLATKKQTINRSQMIHRQAEAPILASAGTTISYQYLITRERNVFLCASELFQGLGLLCH